MSYSYGQRQTDLLTGIRTEAIDEVHAGIDRPGLSRSIEDGRQDVVHNQLQQRSDSRYSDTHRYGDASGGELRFDTEPLSSMMVYNSDLVALSYYRFDHGDLWIRQEASADLTGWQAIPLSFLLLIVWMYRRFV